MARQLSVKQCQGPECRALRASRNVADKFVTCVQREGSHSITSDDCDNLLSLLAQCAALREALRAMLNTYAPLAAETVVLEGEHALHSAVRQARAALALADGAR